MGMFTAALGRYVGDGPLKYFEKRLLNAFSRNVTCNRGVFALTGDFIYFINVDYSSFRSGYIVIRILKEFQKYVFNVFAHIPGFRQGCRVYYSKGYVKRF